MGEDITKIIERWNSRLQTTGLSKIIEQSEKIKKSKSIGDADVYRFDLTSTDSVLIKTYRDRPWIVRKCFASMFIRHEFKILKMLGKDSSLRAPIPYGTVDNHTIAMEFFRDAKTLKGAKHYKKNAMPSEDFFRELIQSIRHLHEIGIAHGDLRRGNVMIDREGHLRLIDVATACHGGRKGNWIRRLLFSMIRRSDNYSLAKIVGSYYENLMDDELRFYIIHAPWYLRLGRFLRQKIYRPLRGKH